VVCFGSLFDSFRFPCSQYMVPYKRLTAQCGIASALLCVAARLVSITDDWLIVETAETAYIYIHINIYIYIYILFVSYLVQKVDLVAN